jgi:hypothetical protein
VWTAYSATEAVTAAVLELEGVRGGLEALQARHNVVAPISVDLRLSGLVEAWAAGCSWEELMKVKRWWVGGWFMCECESSLVGEGSGVSGSDGSDWLWQDC